jgi:hypothetical protein
MCKYANPLHLYFSFRGCASEYSDEGKSGKGTSLTQENRLRVAVVAILVALKVLSNGFPQVVQSCRKARKHWALLIALHPFDPYDDVALKAPSMFTKTGL